MSTQIIFLLQQDQKVVKSETIKNLNDSEDEPQNEEEVTFEVTI